MAIFGMGVMVGPTLGPTLGGWITDNYSWPWIFYINLPLGAMAAYLTWRWVPKPSHGAREQGDVDWAGLLFLILSIGALQILLEREESKDWFESREIQLEALVAALAMVAFVWRELTAEHPVVDLRILKNRQLAASVTFGLCLGFALYASVFALPVFLQSHLGYTAWDTGKVILPGAIASAVTMAITGRITSKFDARLFIVTGAGLYFWSMWMHYHFTLAIGMHDLLLPMILRGIGLGLVFVPLTQVAVADLKPQQLAQGTGLYNLSRQLGGSFGIAVAATLLHRFTEQGREALRSHLAVTEPATAQWLQGVTARMMQLGGGAADAQHRALALLDLNLYRQASVIAFEKVFLVMGCTFMRRSRSSSSSGPAARRAGAAAHTDRRAAGGAAARFPAPHGPDADARRPVPARSPRRRCLPGGRHPVRRADRRLPGPDPRGRGARGDRAGAGGACDTLRGAAAGGGQAARGRAGAAPPRDPPQRHPPDAPDVHGPPGLRPAPGGHLDRGAHLRLQQFHRRAGDGPGRDHPGAPVGARLRRARRLERGGGRHAHLGRHGGHLHRPPRRARRGDARCVGGGGGRQPAGGGVRGAVALRGDAGHRGARHRASGTASPCPPATSAWTPTSSAPSWTGSTPRAAR